jgi:hypothetical protein
MNTHTKKYLRDDETTIYKTLKVIRDTTTQYENRPVVQKVKVRDQIKTQGITLRRCGPTAQGKKAKKTRAGKHLMMIVNSYSCRIIKLSSGKY